MIGKRRRFGGPGGRLRRWGAALGGGVLLIGLVSAPTPAAATVRLVDSPSATRFAGLPDSYTELGQGVEEWLQDQLGRIFGNGTSGEEHPGSDGFGDNDYRGNGGQGEEPGPGYEIPQPGNGSDLPGYGDGEGGSGGIDGGSDTGADVDSEPATARESTGVVVIDTELYSGSAAAGTGIVLTADGQVLTNYHVVEGSTEVEVTVPSTGKEYTAEVVGADKSRDVALLQLEGASGLATATIDDDQPAVGDDVTAVGNAGGTGELTAADGEVTDLNAQITTTSEGGAEGEQLENLIETDADVVSGDSGGPLLDEEGEVIGIDTAASTGSEINGYAVPIDQTLQIVSKINSGAESDQVRIGPAAYLGVQVSDAVRTGNVPGYRPEDSGEQDDTAAGISGAAVIGASSGSPAAEAGLTEGAVITRLGSTKITSAEGLTDAMTGYQPGDRVSLGWVDSAGAEHTETVTLGESPIN